MGGSKLTRETKRLINQLAHDRARGSGEFRKAYLQEKVKLLSAVHIELAKGKTLDEVMLRFKAGKRLIDARESSKKSIDELRRQIIETP